MNTHRHSLVRRHIEMAQHAHAKYLAEGVDRPVVWVLDLTDKNGRELATVALAAQQDLTLEAAASSLARTTAEVTARSCIPATIIVLSHAHSVALAQTLTGSGASNIDRIQAFAAQHGGAPLAVVGDGGNTYTVVPPVGGH